VPSFDVAGYNYRMSDLQAAVMRVQLQRLPDLVAARSRAAAGYVELIGDLEGVTLPVALEDRTHAWQSYVIEIGAPLDRGSVALALRERGVGCNFGTYASHMQPVYDARNDCPVSAGLFARHLAIPMHANLTDDDIEYVATTLREVVQDPAVRRA
jgi:dTDP-4-amino-4,6-dideoxygalactose transaminase